MLVLYVISVKEVWRLRIRMPHRVPSNKGSYKDIPFLKKFFDDNEELDEHTKKLREETKEDG